MDEQPANVPWSTGSDSAEVSGAMYPWVWLLPRVRSPLPLGGVTWSSWIGLSPRCQSLCLPDVSHFGFCSKGHRSRETRTRILAAPLLTYQWVARVAQVGCPSSVSQFSLCKCPGHCLQHPAASLILRASAPSAPMRTGSVGRTKSQQMAEA